MRTEYSISPVENILYDLIGKYGRKREQVSVQVGDDALLTDLGMQLDAVLEKRDEALSMEVYALLVLRAFRTLREV